ncbi:Hvo_1808 family surface protein [Halegenticoccus soli]|uniref:Hvo_1808 family surface protein n=1 Tax=Halegenticoccus soli TaxID=1985678 RepID=UPI0018ECFCBE|nr:Hvo_1808 family surface protein [Halegenticoccus soli]
MHRRTAASAVVCLAVVIAGCAAPVSPPTGDGPESDWDERSSERVGWVNGYRYDDPIAVDQSDGLNESETEAFLARTMARVEVIRGLPFREPVSVRVITREEFRERIAGGGGRSPERAAWHNQVWRALLLVDEGRNVSDVLDGLYGENVLGYYSPRNGEIVVVTDSRTPRIDRRTLSHELVHALQDQHFGLGGRPGTLDGRLARNGLVEGDAGYVEQLYERRCRADWECVPRPPRAGRNVSVADDAFGVYATIYQPYSDGPQLVHERRAAGGWAAVNAMYDRPPASAAQVVHPEKYPDAEPVPVEIEDRSSAEWSRFDVERPADTVGEAALYVALRERGRIGSNHFLSSTDPYSPYNYSHPITDGWAGDSVVPYRSADGEYGYVFRTVWETDADAERFASAYRATLRTGLGTERAGERTYRVPENRPYSGAYRVTRAGDAVTIVNAPTVERLDGVHRPPASADSRRKSADGGSLEPRDPPPAESAFDPLAADRAALPAPPSAVTDVPPAAVGGPFACN